MSIRWARSPSPAYLNKMMEGTPAHLNTTSNSRRSSSVVDVRARMRSVSPFLQSEQGKKWGPKKQQTGGSDLPVKGSRLSQSMDTRQFPTGQSSAFLPICRWSGGA